MEKTANKQRLFKAEQFLSGCFSFKRLRLYFWDAKCTWGFVPVWISILCDACEFALLPPMWKNKTQSKSYTDKKKKKKKSPVRRETDTYCGSFLRNETYDKLSSLLNFSGIWEEDELKIEGEAQK